MTFSNLSYYAICTVLYLANLSLVYPLMMFSSEGENSTFVIKIFNLLINSCWLISGAFIQPIIIFIVPGFLYYQSCITFELTDAY